MVFTVLEGRVKPEHWQKLRDKYAEGTKQLPAMIRETFLLQDANDREIWRIMTVWESREALQAYRESVPVPEGILWFRAVDCEPSMSLSFVENYAGKGV